MATWVDLSTIHTPTAGTRPPASWGAGVAADLDILAGAQAADVVTLGSTSSTSYVDLASVGPSVTCETTDKALVIVSAHAANSSVNEYALASVAVSGASSVSASDNWTALAKGPNESCPILLYPFTGLTPGSNTFTVKYRVTNAGTTGSWTQRRIAVLPLI